MHEIHAEKVHETRLNSIKIAKITVTDTITIIFVVLYLIHVIKGGELKGVNKRALNA